MKESVIRLIFLLLALYVVIMIGIVFLILLPMYVPLSKILNSNPITVYPEGVAKVNPTLKVLEATIAVGWSVHSILGLRRILLDLTKSAYVRTINWVTVMLIIVLVPTVVYAILIL